MPKSMEAPYMRMVQLPNLKAFAGLSSYVSFLIIVFNLLDFCSRRV
jgi:hypothetical protein